jgi:hypothetical protein
MNHLKNARLVSNVEHYIVGNLECVEYLGNDIAERQHISRYEYFHAGNDSGLAGPHFCVG